MLAEAENALIDALKNHRDIRRLVRTVGSLPQALDAELLRQYTVDAPALYVIPGVMQVDDGIATLRFTVAGVVRNVGGQEQARKGDGIDLGTSHMLTLVVRALHCHCIAGCDWTMQRAELVDEVVFAQAGIAAIEMYFVSSPIELDSDFGAAQLDELDDLLHVHADLDLPPGAGTAAHQQWLATPPNYTSAAPDAQLDITLPGPPP